MGGTSERKSIDWIAVFPECVLLVEVKSSRPPEGVRIGDPDAIKKQFSELAYARTQIDRTAECVIDRIPEFTEIPHDRPIVGLVITMEPWHNADFVVRDVVKEEWATPATYWGASTLEHFASYEIPQPGTVIMEAVEAAQRGRLLAEVFGDYPVRENPVLEKAWNQLPWSI